MAVASAARYLANSKLKVGNVAHGVLNNLNIGIVVLESPSRTNALSGSMMLQLGAIAAAYSAPPAHTTSALDSVSALVIIGSGKHFCAGADLASMMEDSTGSSMNRYMQIITHSLRHSVLPCTIAAVHGAAFGGGAELASSADLRVGTPQTRAAFVQARMGLSTGWGGTHMLRETVGRANALKMLLSAAPYESSALSSMRWLDDIDPEPIHEAGAQTGESCACMNVPPDTWDSLVSAGSQQMLRSVDSSAEAESEDFAEVLRNHPPADFDKTVLSPQALHLLRFVAEQYALPARSAALARAPKTILNSNNPLRREQQLFGELWRGEAHTAALLDANRA